VAAAKAECAPPELPLEERGMIIKPTRVAPAAEEMITCGIEPFVAIRRIAICGGA
jgi:hypothetical protein